MNHPFRLCAFADEASRDLDGQIKALRENGMELLEIRGVDGKNVAKLTHDEAKETAARLSDGGIRVWSIGSPIGKCDISDPPEHELDRFLRVLDTANVLGASRIRLFSFYGCTDADAGRVIGRLSEFIERSRGSGVLLCHENEKGIFGDVADRCRILLSALPELSAVFDPANYVQCGENTLRAWELTGEFTDYVHIKDALADGRVVPAGAGEGHLPEILKLAAVRGIEVLTLEPHLKVFEGLSALEKGNPDVGSLAFESGREAFDYATNTLKEVLNNSRA